MAGPAFASVPLFGGALRCELPPTLRDVAELRDVPDHQEAFAQRGRPSPLSLVVEVLERVEHAAAGGACAAWFLADLAETNGAAARIEEAGSALSLERDLPRLLLPPARAPGAEAWRARAVQCVLRKFAGADVFDDVLVLLAALRLPAVGSDILLTVNVALREGGRPDGGAAVEAALRAEAAAVFERALATLEVADWGLFHS